MKHKADGTENYSPCKATPENPKYLGAKIKKEKEKIMKNTKLYPFSIAKHGHDIEFRYNRLKNIESDYFSGEIDLTDGEFDRLEEELELVTKAYEIILNTFSNGKVVWVDGATLGILNECVAWATTERDSHKH